MPRAASRRARLREALAQVLAAPPQVLPPALELAALQRRAPLQLLRVTDLPAARLQLVDLVGAPAPC